MIYTFIWDLEKGTRLDPWNIKLIWYGLSELYADKVTVKSHNIMVMAYYNSSVASCIEKHIPYSAKFWRGEILTDNDSSNTWRKIFWRMVTVFHYTPVNAKQSDGLNIDGLAGNHQKYQNFPPSKFCTIQYVAITLL